MAGRLPQVAYRRPPSHADREFMKDQVHDLEVRDRRRRERSLWRTAFLVSVLFHLLLFVAWRGKLIPVSPSAAAGPRAGDARAAPGGMQAVNIEAASVLPPIPRPPIPVMAKVDVKPVTFTDSIPRDMASLLGSKPGDALTPGIAGGTGRGDGGTAASGRHRTDGPSPRGMIIPPANKKLKGTTVEVWVFVNAKGSVVPDSTRLDPPTSDASFNKRLIREAAQWVFNPARRGGKPVASWFPYKISM